MDARMRNCRNEPHDGGTAVCDHPIWYILYWMLDKKFYSLKVDCKLKPFVTTILFYIYGNNAKRAGAVLGFLRNMERLHYVNEILILGILSMWDWGFIWIFVRKSYFYGK